ncbi:helix-turn-helix domain-containing protein [Salinactinospora qingdaonensis]|uniref:Helix-turn-helix transcriptional regulator n=1 Tax=Salinactinospora qingdaonensis TaxID=702744 RepID=A0ABP7G3G6_9ACTN
MAAKTKVTLRAQWLGKMLKELREDAGLTLREPADHIRRSTSTLSRYESGTLPITQGEVTELMNLYGVEEKSQRTAMLQLADEITKTGWWDRYSKDISRTTDYVWLESRSQHVRVFSPLVVPGLLQTPQYAETVIKTADPDASKQQIERWVSARMTRQRVIEGENPTALSVILEEAVLRCPTGGPAIMAEQVRHLCVMAERPNIELRVLPFDSGAYPNPGGEFTLFKLADPFPEVVHVDSVAGVIFLEREDAARLAALYGRLEGHCLSVADSAAMVMALEKELS